MAKRGSLTMEKKGSTEGLAEMLARQSQVDPGHVNDAKSAAEAVVVVDPDEALFDAMEHEAEDASQDDDEDMEYAHSGDGSDSEDGMAGLDEKARKRVIYQEKARALCPIRTRYLPEYEEQQQRKTSSSMSKTKSGSQSDLQRGASSGILSRASSSGNLRTKNPAVRAVKRAKRMFRGFARAAKAETKAVKAATTEFSKTAWQDVKTGGAGADRITAEITGRAYHADPDDLTAFGVVGQQLRVVLQNRAFDSLMVKTHLTKAESPFTEMQAAGRYFCTDQDQTDVSMEDVELQKLIAEPRFQSLRSKGISRQEAMAMMHTDGGGADAEADKARSDGQHHKGTISMQTVEDVWWSNCKGQAAIRRKPEGHEAVYDFADNRISMPKYTMGSAGQLVTVKPDLHHHGMVGEVTMHTCVPKRVVALHVATRLEDLPPDQVITLEKGADDVNRCDHGLSRHAHLTTRALPPSSKAWLDWRDAQIAKRRAAYDAALAAGLASRAGPAQVAKDDDFHSQSSGEDLEAVMAMSGGGDTARDSAGVQSTRVPVESGRQTPKDPASARRGRRQGLDMATLLSDDTRWDSRPPPTQMELKSILAKCANMAGHQTHVPMSFAAIETEEKSSARDRLSARGSKKPESARGGLGMAQKVDDIGCVVVEMDDPFADDLRERCWTLRSVKKEGQENTAQLDIVFAVALASGFERESLEDVEKQEYEDDFWAEIIRPVPRTWMDQLKDVLGLS